MTDLQVSVNVSTQQVQPYTLMESIVGALTESGLASDSLVVELTESMAMDDPELKIELLNKIKASGVCFSVDDFGTGYSSLSYLQRLPITELKIDRSFIVDLPENKDGGAIVSAIVAMAHSLGLKVVAEGIETQAQLDFMRTVNCDIIQGYFYSKPLNKKDFEIYAATLR